MPEPHVYEYAFIRFVPKVERGECINVGVILFCKRKRFLAVKTHLDEARILAFAKEADLNLLAAYLQTWELIANGDTRGGEIAKLDAAGRFRWLTASRSTIIQSSEVHPGLSADPARVLEQMFEKYVL